MASKQKKQQLKNQRKNRRRQNKAEDRVDDEVIAQQVEDQNQEEDLVGSDSVASEERETTPSPKDSDKDESEDENDSQPKKKKDDQDDDVAFIVANDLRKGVCVLMCNNMFPCKVVEMKKAKTGKHGGCKIRVIGLDVLTTKKHEDIFNSHDQVSVPAIKKTKYDVKDVKGDHVILQDVAGAVVAKNGSCVEKKVKILPETNEIHADLVQKFRNGQKLSVVVVNVMQQDNVVEVRAI